MRRTTVQPKGPRKLAWLFVLGLAALPLQGRSAPAASAPPAAPAAATTTAAPPASAAATPPAASASVIGVSRELAGGAKAGGSSPQVSLGEVLTVQVANLATLVAAQKPIILFLDKRPLKDLTPYPPTDLKDGILRFVLRQPRSDDTSPEAKASREVWTYLLGSPRWRPRPTAVSIGLADGSAIPSTSTIDLVVIPQGPFLLWLAIFAVISIAFWILALRSNLLRAPTSAPDAGERPPYSLGRTQAAWWFFLVLASYLFIGLVTADFGTPITSTVLTLLGISAGTVVGAAFIDQSKNGPAATADAAKVAQTIQNQMAALETKVVAAAATVAAAPPSTPAEAQAKLALATHTSDLQQKQSLLKKTRGQSEQFLLDILSDANGVAFHRFQIVAWTLVLGIIFGHEVYKVLAMPTFDSSLLALMGISSGTYLGMKIPEPTVPKP
jgi:hypothetical protein